MNTSSNSELISTTVFGTMVLTVLAFNGMGTAVFMGALIAASVLIGTHFLSNK